MNWISVEDRLPGKDDVVDIFIPRFSQRWTDYKYFHNAGGDSSNNFFYPTNARGGSIVRDVTHWMLSPEAPTGELYE